MDHMESIAHVEITPSARAGSGRQPSGLRQRLRVADRTALGDLYDLYARQIYGLALWWSGRVEEAEDVVQETFVRVWEKRHLVARARDLDAYLLRMAKTIAAGRHRRAKVSEPLEEAALLLPADLDPERQIDASRLSRHLHRLSPKLRSVVYLHSFLDLSFRQVGVVLGIPMFTAASRYRLALERLRQMMEISDV